MTLKMIPKVSKIVSDSYNKKEIDFAATQLKNILDVEKVRKEQIKEQINQPILNQTILAFSNEVSNLENYLEQVESNIKKIESYLEVLSSRTVLQTLTKNEYKLNFNF